MCLVAPRLFQAGVSDRHHDMIIHRLTDPDTIASSRQFPFRFLSAFKSLPDPSHHAPQRRVLHRGAGRRARNRPAPPAPNAALIERYKAALNTAVELATM